MQESEHAPAPAPAALRVPRRQRNLERTEAGCLVMSEENLKQICETDGLYEFPEMNKKIYLHYKVIEHIGGLDKYVNLKSLYLENNVISRIQGLQALGQLENLFLHNNMIKRIEGLERLKELKILNLANNNIFVVEGLSQLPQLQNVTLTKNYLSDFASLEHFGHCALTLTSIDLADNKVEADERLFDLIRQAKCLYLYGNPLVRQVPHYRRTIIGKLPELLYLDQRAVEREERMLAEAWVREGEAGFRKAREGIAEYRKQRREEQRSEVMKNIDVHRRNKINVFEKNILEAEEEIGKLRGYMGEAGNESQHFFYETRISEFMVKIKENQEFIDSIYKRMGIDPLPPVYTISLTLHPTLPEPSREGIFEIREEDEEESLAGSEHNSNSHSQEGSNPESHSSTPVSDSSNSQESSVKTYYSNMDELD